MDILTISQLTRAIKSRLNQQFPAVWVSGEISGVTQPSSGHVYFTLKDAHAQLNAILWSSDAEQIDFRLTNGLKVICRGGIDVYPPRGSYQMIVRRIQPQGIGALELAFRQLHAKLAAEGLFAQEHKRPIPSVPNHIAVVTSPTGAAVRDFLQVLTRRWPHVRTTIVPARVQGAGAAADIALGLEQCQHLSEPPDVIVVTRGGGSIEDLWPFNEEQVVRAIYHSVIPVVSGVGHEIDVTLADLAADVRALTPSEAAERVVPDQAEVTRQLGSWQARMGQGMLRQLRQAEQDLAALATRPVMTRPLDSMQNRQIDVDHLEHRLLHATRRRMEEWQQSVANQTHRLESISPLGTLARGYSLTTDTDGRLIGSAKSVTIGQTIQTRVHDGVINSKVTYIDR